MTPPRSTILPQFAAQGPADTEMFSYFEEHFVISALGFYPGLEPKHTEELMILWAVQPQQQTSFCLQWSRS